MTCEFSHQIDGCEMGNDRIVWASVTVTLVEEGGSGMSRSRVNKLDQETGNDIMHLLL